MLIHVLFGFLLSTGLAPSNSKPKPYNDADVIAESMLDRITDNAEEREDTTIDRYEDEEGKEEDMQLILKTLREIHAYKHHRSRIKPYENYEHENDELDAEVDREYSKALIKLYKDLAKDRRKQDIHKKGRDIKSKIKSKLKDNSNENTGYLSVGKRNKVDISEIGTLHRSARKKDFRLLPIERNADAKRKRNELFTSGNNYQVASVKVDDTLEKEENVITKLDPKEISLEADSNGTNQNNSSKSRPRHSHIKSSPPKTKVTSTKHTHHGLDQTTFFAIIAGCCVAGVAGIILASFCWYKLRQESKASNGKQSPTSIKESDHNDEKKVKSQDEKMVESAEVFHYLHAKKQMQQMAEPPVKADYSNGETTDDEEDEDTVYECPGLAPPGDMKVVNPLFSDAESHHSDKHSDSSPLSDAASPTPPPPYSATVQDEIPPNVP